MSIRFVYDLGFRGRPAARALIDALVDPVAIHLPGAVKADAPSPDDLNVRYWHEDQHDVFICHGISDKGWRDVDAVGGFAHIFHSGPAWQRKYLAQGVGAERLHQVGYAKLDPLIDGTIVRQHHTILWAPTLRRHWADQYDRLAGAIQELPFEVETSQHPVDAPGNVTLQQLADADVVIADGGSMLYEAWALDKPVVFPDFAVLHSDLIRPGTMEADIYAAGIGYHVDDERELAATIERARQQGITPTERSMIDDVFAPELRGVSGWRHAVALTDIAERSQGRWTA